MLEKGVEEFYIGIDESNHGRFPEVFVAFASSIRNDSRIIPEFPEITQQNIFDLMRKRDYRYALICKRHYEDYGNLGLIAQIASELIIDFDFVPSSLNIYVDGELKREQRTITKELVAGKLNIPSQRILVKGVPKHKRNDTNLLIALSDELANLIYYRESTNRTTPGMKKRKIDFP